MKIRKWISWGAVTLALATPSPGCGPWFPRSWLYTSDAFLTDAPVLSFANEIDALLPVGGPTLVFQPTRADLSPAEGTRAMDLAEIESALASANLPQRARGNALKSAQILRDCIAELRVIRKTRANWPSWDQRPPPSESTVRAIEEKLRHCTLSPNLPAQYRLYLEGAKAYHLLAYNEARSCWKALLELPPAERRERTVWAIYMLGRIAAPDEAPQWFQQVRARVREGFTDSIQLAVTSLGEEARAHLDAGRPERAIELYLAQYQAGQPGALESLRLATSSLLRDSDFDGLVRLARHPISRRVITASVLSDQPCETSPGSPQQRWLAALEHSAQCLPTEASRLALAAYQVNAMQQTHEWLALAPRADPLAQWLRAKLLLRDGQIEAGRAILEGLLADLPPSFEERWETPHPGSFRRRSEAESLTGLSTARLGTESGLLALAASDFPTAARHFWHARQWHEFAYVTERLLSSDELFQLTTELTAGPDEGDLDVMDFSARLRDLTARRFVREGRFDMAAPFFTPEKRSLLASYQDAVQQGFDIDRPNRDRARALWEAAKIMRSHGLALASTELAPDYGMTNGLFSLGDEAQIRREQFSTRSLLRPSREELEMTSHDPATPPRQFHYRYVAAEWAALAAQLLPTDDGDAARILIVAGGWLKKQDPDAANRYYRQLALQCGRHPLGAAANELHWFPELDREPFSVESSDAIPL